LCQNQAQIIIGGKEMSNVIGQTGRVVLSDYVIMFERSKKRTVRYRYSLISSVKVATDKGKDRTVCLWKAEVIGPFHSAYYGTCAFGSKKLRSKAALERRLGNEFGYIGTLLYSDDDTADNVGEVDLRLWDDHQNGRPITKTSGELVGSAGA
jgi:hypothetical protein